MHNTESSSVPTKEPEVEQQPVTANLLVEDVSIDGMCGVY